VSVSTIYGGTYNLFAVTMKRMGIDFTFVRPDCTDEELDAAFRPNTKAVFGETIANPALVVLDLERWSKAAHDHGVPLIIDNTFATPVNCRPFEWGADIVVHSTTKYMDGHGAAVGGCIVDSGKFDWTKYPDKFPGLCTPDESYHGVVYTERFGLGGAFITKCTAQLMRDFGSIQSPQNAFLLNLGLESLHVRMERHCANGLAVARYLKNHPKVRFVSHPDDNKFPLNYPALVQAAKELGVALEVNNASLRKTKLRPGSDDNYRVLLPLCAEVGVNIIVNTDSHDPSTVGDFNLAQMLLEEVGFPDALIVNNDLRKVKGFLMDY